VCLCVCERESCAEIVSGCVCVCACVCVCVCVCVYVGLFLCVRET